MDHNDGIPGWPDAGASSQSTGKRVDRVMTDFTKTRAMFHIPDRVVYLDGNSLGALPIAAKARIAGVMTDEWGEQLIRGWNTAGWMTQPRRGGDRVARLIGAPAGTVVMGDTLSIKLYQALAAALALNPRRAV